MKKTIRNAVLIVLAMAIVASVSIFGTIAWLSDEDGAVNVMTLGNVYIDQNEYEYNANGELVEFTQGKPLLPVVDANNVIDKIVTVTNTGSTGAYVRTIFAFEKGTLGTDSKTFAETVSMDVNTTDWTWSDSFEAVIGNNTYVIMVATYNKVLTPGVETEPSLNKVWMNAVADNEEVVAVDGNGNKMYDILVFSQAVQSTGFTSASEALDRGFGVVDVTNLPWDANNVVVPNIVTTAEALINALKNDADVYLASDIDLAGVEWDSIDLYSGTLNGQGYSIKNLKGENGLFEVLDGATVKNLKIENAEINATSNYTGILAGQIKKNASAPQTVIENVTVSGTVVGGAYYTSGIIGADSGMNTVIKNCVNNADVTTNGQQVGGILGYSKRLTLVDNCVNNGDIVGSSFVGGIIGLVAVEDEDTSLTVTVQNCVNYGDVSTNSTITYSNYFGGIAGVVGREGGKAPINECTAYILNNTVVKGQSVYGGKVNVATGRDELINVVVDGTEEVAVADTAANFKDAALDGGNIVLTGKLTVEDIQFFGGSNEMTISGGTFSRDSGNGNALTVNTTEKVTFNGVNFETVKGNAVLETRKNGANIELNDCTFTSFAAPSTGNSGVQVYASNVTFVFNNCTFNNTPILTNSSYKENITLVFNNCTFTWTGDNCPGMIKLANYVEADIDLNDCKFVYTTTSQYTSNKNFVSYSSPVGASTIDFNNFEVVGNRTNGGTWKLCGTSNNVTINATGDLSYTFNGAAVDFNAYLK